MSSKKFKNKVETQSSLRELARIAAIKRKTETTHNQAKRLRGLLAQRLDIQGPVTIVIGQDDEPFYEKDGLKFGEHFFSLVLLSVDGVPTFSKDSSTDYYAYEIFSLDQLSETIDKFYVSRPKPLGKELISMWTKVKKWVKVHFN